MPGSEKAFKKYEWEEIATHDIPYDVGSIMHYGAYVNIPFSDLFLLLFVVVVVVFICDWNFKHVLFL